MTFAHKSGITIILMMLLSAQEKSFIVETYFRSYGVGRNDGPSLKFVSTRFEERFNKRFPTKRSISLLVIKFRRTGSTLTQRKGKSGEGNF